VVPEAAIAPVLAQLAVDVLRDVNAWLAQVDVVVDDEHAVS
jgi:hypothetical protein